MLLCNESSNQKNRNAIASVTVPACKLGARSKNTVSTISSVTSEANRLKMALVSSTNTGVLLSAL